MIEKKIAIYALYGGGEYIKEYCDFINEDTDYQRLSEPVDVEFEERDPAAVVADKVDWLNSKKERKQAEHVVEINRIDDQIQQLMALEHIIDE